MDQHDTLMQSPLVLSHGDLAALDGSPAFRVLRSHLAADADFCKSHTQCHRAAKNTFLLHRDTLYALIMPVVAVFLRSSALASAALCTSNSEDLELAFSGDARSAFLCLQCFITEEKDWCQTKGCPACIVTAVLSTESHIRLTIAASLLSTTSASTSPSTDTTADRHLPPLLDMLPALRSALTADNFWKNANIWPYLLSRATQLSTGIQELISQCFDLESLVSSSQVEQQPEFQRRNAANPNVTFLGSSKAVHKQGTKLRKSKLAKRQLRLKDEEIEAMRRYAFQCWVRLHVGNEILGVSKSNRSRSLTCP